MGKAHNGPVGGGAGAAGALLELVEPTPGVRVGAAVTVIRLAGVAVGSGVKVATAFGLGLSVAVAGAIGGPLPPLPAGIIGSTSTWGVRAASA